MSHIILKRMPWTLRRQFFRLLKNIARDGSRRDFVLRELPKRSVGCELGVWRGGFSARILAVVKPAHLLLVDPWEYQPQLGYETYGGAVAKSQQEMDAICHDVRARFEGRDGVSIIRKKTVQLGDDDIAPESLDWVYIDGCHEYEAVLADLRFFLTRVKRGGLICGDDYDDKHYGMVNRAVAEFLEQNPNCQLLWVKKRQFMIRVAR